MTSLDEMYRDLEEADKLGDERLARAIAQRINEAKQKPQGPVDFDAATMIKNVPSSVGKIATDVWSAVSDPIGTGKAIGSLAQSTGNMLGRKAAELTTGQDFPAGLLRDETVAQATIQGAKDRYGSIDALKRTAMEDPAGMMLDVSGVGALGASAAPRIGRMVAGAAEPITVAGNIARTVGKGAMQIPGVRALPDYLYNKAAKWSTTLTPDERLRLNRTAMTEGIRPTEGGVRKVQNRIEILDETLNELITKSSATGKPIRLDEVFRYLQDLRRTKGGVRIGGADDVAEIDRLTSTFMNDMHDQGKTMVTLKELQNLKTEAYKSVNYSAKRNVNAPIEEDFMKTVARGAKDTIVENLPEAADINKRLSDLYNLEPAMRRSAGRMANNNIGGIGAPLKITAGNAVGNALGMPGAGTTIGAVMGLIEMPAFKATAAIILNKLKTGDVKWLRDNVTRQEITAALTMAGREKENQVATQ
jgi:hypothetical protein